MAARVGLGSSGSVKGMREREYMLGKEERGIEVKLVFANVNTCGATGETFEADP